MKAVLKTTAVFFAAMSIACVSYAQSSKKSRKESPKKVDVQNLEKDSLILYTWNIGYAGLDKKSDFFYDGGKMVRPPEDRVQASMKGILGEINSWNDADVIFLQEVDVHSKRSYYIPEKQTLIEAQKDFPVSVFGLNYKVKYVPKPYLEPMGAVESGILMFSKYWLKIGEVLP